MIMMIVMMTKMMVKKKKKKMQTRKRVCMILCMWTDNYSLPTVREWRR